MRVRLIAVVVLALLGAGLLIPLGLRAQIDASAVQTERWTQTELAAWNNGTLDGLIATNNDDGEIRLDRDSTRGVYTSSAFEAPFAFNTAVAEWDVDVPAQTTLALELRTSPNGTEWRDWAPVEAVRQISPTLSVRGPVMTDADSRWLQYRITFTSEAQPAVPEVRAASWLLLNSTQGPGLTDQPPRVPILAREAVETRPPLMIPRTAWGAATIAPDLTPDRPRQLAVEAVPMPAGGDALAMLRALQAVSQSYSNRDLPYAYVVDSAGNVYQGRIGTPSRNGVITIGLLGDLTDAARVSLAQTLAWLAQSNDLALSLNATGLSAEEAESIRIAADRATVRSRWTFVESNTRDYNQRIMLFNPTSQEALATLTFLPGQANSIQREYTVAANTRVDIQINEIFSDTAVLPIEVTANRQIIAERTMLFANDALSEPGIESFSRTWYFAEGDGSQGRSTSLKLYNPQPTAVAAQVLIIPTSGLTETRDVVIEPFTVEDLTLSADVQQAFGFRVAATAPIAAERTMLFGPTRNGGFLTRGAVAPAREWYFAEGATIAPFTTTLALLNPSPVAAAITTTFLTDQGTTFTRRYQIPSNSRITVELRDVIPAPQGVGTIVTASQPIVAERTTFFNNGNSGTNTLGASKLAYAWRFAEGRTAEPADEFIILANPNQKAAQVELVIAKGDGTSQTLSYTVPRTGRIAVLLDNDLPFEQTHSTLVRSTLPIVAERTILIANDGGGGGHTALGVPER